MEQQQRHVPRVCPFCGGGIEVTRIRCGACDTTFDGRFAPGAFGNLTPEQWGFVETFIRCRGKIKDVEVALDLSYPTVVSRLNDVVAALGFETGDGPAVARRESATSERRRQVLERLKQGELSPKEALRLLEAKG